MVQLVLLTVEVPHKEVRSAFCGIIANVMLALNALEYALALSGRSVDSGEI
jgi:hypothetical protein